MSHMTDKDFLELCWSEHTSIQDCISEGNKHCNKWYHRNLTTVQVQEAYTLLDKEMKAWFLDSRDCS